MFEPTTDGKADGLFISKGYDATSHFETSIDDVMEMYTRITGEKLDLTNLPADEPEDGAGAGTAAAPAEGGDGKPPPAAGTGAPPPPPAPPAKAPIPPPPAPTKQ